MICIRCGKEINPNKTYAESMHKDKVIGYVHMSCFNKQFMEEKDDE